MQKQFSLIIILLLLSVIIFITYNGYDIGKKNSENQYNILISDLNRDTTDFTAWISDKKEILNTARDVVDNFSYDEITAWETLNPYLNINNDDPDISRIFIGLETGKFITGGQWIPPVDYDPRERVWYREAVEAGKTIISPVYIDLESGDRTVTISSPLYLEDRFAGVISADVFINDINNWLTRQINRENIYTYLMDSEGTIIIHTLRPELVGTNGSRDVELYETSFKKKETMDDYFRQARETNEIVRMEYVINGRRTRGIIRRIEDGDWFLAVSTRDDESILHFLEQNSRSILFNILMLGIILSLLLLVIRIKHELEEKNQILTMDNERDFLTGIFNRRYFNLYMDNLWKSREDYGRTSILMIDIDHFKGYNDTYGHISGDEVLKSVTGAINGTIRRQDIFARYGGEEFVLILTMVSPEDARKIGEKILESVYERNIENISSPMGRITISIGVASLVGEEQIDVRQFINRADQALYRAKNTGRNRIVVYPEEN